MSENRRGDFLTHTVFLSLFKEKLSLCWIFSAFERNFGGQCTAVVRSVGRRYSSDRQWTVYRRAYCHSCIHRSTQTLPGPQQAVLYNVFMLLFMLSFYCICSQNFTVGSDAKVAFRNSTPICILFINCRTQADSVVSIFISFVKISIQLIISKISSIIFILNK